VARGFSSATLWSANFPAVALVLQFTGVSWLKILPAGLTLSFLLYLLCYLWEKVIGGTVLGWLSARPVGLPGHLFSLWGWFFLAAGGCCRHAEAAIIVHRFKVRPELTVKVGY